MYVYIKSESKLWTVGFPADLYEQPSQIYVEVYNGKLRVHVWDDQSQDPKATVEIDAIA